MKTNLNKALYKIILFTSCLYGYVANAQDPCPPFPAPCDPPGDPLPIGENISILIIATVFFGIYIIYKYKLNKKRPI
jgi:hypothetical protein